MKKSTPISTIKKFLQIAMKPVGKTLYVYGGGWNEEDTGAGKGARRLGISPTWNAFYATQDKNYNYKMYAYKNALGLDCTGYVGWAIYNTLETEDEKEGYVFSSKEMVTQLADLGLGKKIDKTQIKEYKPGDILGSSINKHVWISLGQCADNSVLFVHASPPGISVCGTPTPTNQEKSQAITIATEFMKTNHPDWYGKFPQSTSRGIDYLENFDLFHWNIGETGILTDRENILGLTPEAVLKALL